MTRPFSTLLVAAALVPVARAADPPLPAAFVSFTAPPASEARRAQGDRFGLFSRENLPEGERPGEWLGSARHKTALDSFRRAALAEAVGNPCGPAHARYAKFLQTLASTRAQMGDLRGAIALQEQAILLGEDARACEEARLRLASYLAEEAKSEDLWPRAWFTVDGLPNRLATHR